MTAKLELSKAMDGLRDAQLSALAERVRSFLIRSVRRTGGHLGSGLGVVELTIALLAEFDFNDRDKLVWDVGHQAYPYKVLTGRSEGFPSLRQRNGLSGFPDPAESPYDTVKTGHGGTSISTATGFALAWRDAEPDRDRRAVAVIGDGALQEGNAYEALNHAGASDRPGLVVVLNDNGMAISPSVGAVHGALSRLKAKQGVGAAETLRHLFGEFGFAYIGPVDGHDIGALRRVFRVARRATGPVIVHALTEKGRGWQPAGRDRTRSHAVPEIAVHAAGEVEYSEQGGPAFATAFGEKAVAMAERDPRVEVVTAAMVDGTGLAEFALRFPDRCHDVGMAEQHAVALAAGLALAGKRPICAIYSTFLQRACDQLFQEVALQKAKVLFCLDRAGLVGADGATHNGAFDIGLLRSLPDFALLAPRDTGELADMMELAATWDGPVAIRYPRGAGAGPESQLPRSQRRIGEAEGVAPGRDGVLLAYGTMTYVALEVRRLVREVSGRELAVVDARCAKPLDERWIEHEWRRQPFVFTLEDHATACGFGSAVAELGLTRLRGRVDMNKLVAFGLPDRFVDHGQRTEQLASVGLDAATLARRIVAHLESPTLRRHYPHIVKCDAAESRLNVDDCCRVVESVRA